MKTQEILDQISSTAMDYYSRAIQKNRDKGYSYLLEYSYLGDKIGKDKKNFLDNNRSQIKEGLEQLMKSENVRIFVEFVDKTGKILLMQREGYDRNNDNHILLRIDLSLREYLTDLLEIENIEEKTEKEDAERINSLYARKLLFISFRGMDTKKMLSNLKLRNKVRLQKIFEIAMNPDFLKYFESNFKQRYGPEWADRMEMQKQAITAFFNTHLKDKNFRTNKLSEKELSEWLIHQQK